MQKDIKYIVHFDTGRSWRGGQNQVYLLISGLKDYGMKQLLVTPEGSPLEEKVKNLDVEIKNIDPVNDLDVISGIKFRKIIKQKRPDIIHFHTSKSLGVGCWALKGLPLKTVVTRRVDLPISKNPINLKKYRYPDSIVVISEYIKKYFNKLGFANVDRIYSSVDLERFEFSKDEKRSSVVNIGMIGAFDLRHKDFITFIEAANYVLKKKKKRNGIKFLIAGKGKDENKIKRYIKSLNIEKEVEISGFFVDIRKFMYSLDILIHTVNFEGLGTSILQAMSAGLPVIATDIGGIPELIENGKNGFLVEKNNPMETSEKLIKLIEDSELRNQFITNSRKLIEIMFSKEKMMENYMELYRKI